MLTFSSALFRPLLPPFHWLPQVCPDGYVAMGHYVAVGFDKPDTQSMVCMSVDMAGSTSFDVVWTVWLSPSLFSHIITNVFLFLVSLFSVRRARMFLAFRSPPCGKFMGCTIFTSAPQDILTEVKLTRSMKVDPLYLFLTLLYFSFPPLPALSTLLTNLWSTLRIWRITSQQLPRTPRVQWFGRLQQKNWYGLLFYLSNSFHFPWTYVFVKYRWVLMYVWIRRPLMSGYQRMRLVSPSSPSHAPALISSLPPKHLRSKTTE